MRIKGEIKDQTGFVMPVGSIIAYGGSTAPEGWLLCNGQRINEEKFSALKDVLKRNSIPDLRDRFVVGAGGKYELHKAGGQESVILTIGQMPDHGHLNNNNNNFTETENDGEHHHYIMTSGGGKYADRFYVEIKANPLCSLKAAGNHGDSNSYVLNGEIKTPDIGKTSETAYKHKINTNFLKNVGDNEAHENRLPYYALTYIIKY